MAGVAVFNLKHVALDATLTTPLVIVSYETEAKPNWASTEVYGRMDPIFSYQNTVRTFKAVLRTPRSNEKFTESQYNVFVEGGKSPTAFEAAAIPPTIPGGITQTKYTWIAGPDDYLRDIADLYKMMYPVYRAPNLDRFVPKSTGDMVGSPLMTLDLSGIAYDGLQGAGATNLGNGMLFVPQDFSVTSLVDTAKPSITLSTGADLKFFANAEGYTITLGGTVLHRSGQVGFLFDFQGNIAFGQGKNFPYNTSNKSAFYEPSLILESLRDNFIVLDRAYSAEVQRREEEEEEADLTRRLRMAPTATEVERCTEAIELFKDADASGIGVDQARLDMEDACAGRPSRASAEF